MSQSVLYEDNHLLVVNKPAGLPTQGAADGEASLVTAAKEYLKQKYRKPGNVFLGVVSRLDSLVTGVVVLARTSKAAARLSEQFRDGTVEKIYWAAVEGRPPHAAGTCENWVLKDESQQRMIVVPQATPGGQFARLRYQTLQQSPTATLLRIELETGRKHQIRLQLSELDCPVIGDHKYGSRRDFPAGIALHARQLSFAHPTREERLTFVAPLSRAWQVLGFAEE